MADNKTDFLRFNAYSIKELITRKLSENSKFTDQVYEDSNIAILIDLVSYMYQCLMFQLNNAASESMFSDTQIYENINRLVNLIGYNPRGCYPSSVLVNIQNNDENSKVVLPKYIYFETNKTDSNGRRICFSQRQQSVEQTGMNQNTLEYEDTIQDTFYNGQWTLYGTVFTASGTENETFVLNIGSNIDNEEYVPGEFIDVYIQGSDGTFKQWTRDDDGVFANSTNVNMIDTSNTTIYGKNKTIFGVRLNEDKKYEIKFGTGVVGKKLNKGDNIYIVYLDSNGPDGDVDVSEINTDELDLKCAVDYFNFSSETYKNFMGSSDISSKDDTSKIIGKVTATLASSFVSSFKQEEDVETIRENGPSWFKLGNRLITREDYEYFIKNNYSARACFQNKDIVDVRCMNNIEYVSTFYKWLYQCGLDGKRQNLEGFSDGGAHYLNQKFWRRTDYKYIDPSDANNTYIWVKTGDMNKVDQQDLYDVSVVEQQLNKVLKPMKTLTTEIQVVKPVVVNFDICAASDYEYIRKYYILSNSSTFDSNCESYIEITIDDDTLYVSMSIQNNVVDIIKDAFNVNKCTLGQNINYSEILNSIYEIPGVKRVRTVFKPLATDIMETRVVDGISFASWSPILDEDQNSCGIDLEVGNTNRHLNDFQFPRFIGNSNLNSRIKIIKNSLVTVNTIKM